MDKIKTGETERDVADALRNQAPVKGLPGVSIRDVRKQPDQPFDISFQLRSGPNSVQVFGEIKPTLSPRLLEEIAPWIRRLKSLRGDVAVAVIAPMLSPQAQSFCLQNEIDFMDLAGNIFINVPGKFTLQRSGMRGPRIAAANPEGQRTINAFSGRSSRVLRVLLENPKPWRVTEIARALSVESKRFSNQFPDIPIDFGVSLGSVSKAITSLEEQLWVRRRGKTVIVPEPWRVLRQWAEKYRERYRWRLRNSFQTSNPFGRDLARINEGLQELIPGVYAFSGAAAASAVAPFVDIDIFDVFLLGSDGDVKLRELKSRPGAEPPLRFNYPYDAGVFMYSKQVDGVPLVSSVQAYLDLYARGGRDLKQAEYLLTNTIQKRWAIA